MRLRIGVVVAGGLVVVLTAGWVLAGRGAFTLVSVWGTEVGGAGRVGVVLDRAPQIWSVDADRHELHPGILPSGWRWAPWIVVVRRDRFVRTVASSARSVWRLPARVTPPGTPEGDMPAIRLLESRPDGGILVEAEGRRRWLAPGQSWAMAVVEGRPAAWWDAGDASWHEAVGEALAHGRHVAVWRVTHYGTWPRAALAGGAGR